MGDDMKIIQDLTPQIQIIPTDRVDGKHKALIKDGKIEQMSFRDSIFLGPWDGENPQVKENDKQGDTTDEDCVSSQSEQEDRSGY